MIYYNIMEMFTMITGATGGIGEEFSFTLAARGNNLFLTGRSEDKLSSLSNRIKERYPSIKIAYFACMLDDENERNRLFAFIEDGGYTFNRFVSVAGVDTQLAFEKYTQQKLLFQLRVNFEAAVSLSRFVLSHRGDGLEMLVVSSISGACPMPYFALYSATKSALISFFSALRVELKGKGVKVTVLMPGSVPTRQDVIEDIKRQGLKGRLSSKPKSFVVRKGLEAVSKNKRIEVPGLFNKLVYLSTRIAPTWATSAFVEKGWKNKEKDAFCVK
jgi:short-subunit dehydrogenase